MSSSSQQQGAAFENLLHELLRRILAEDLAYELLQNSLQSSGIQYGKDIQTKWRDPSGEECFWHFECKSHQGGVLHQREVADKIIDVYRSAHRINVWCLALAHVEPSVWIDEVFPWMNDHFNMPFCLAVLSPNRNFIKELFACHADLYEQLYPGEPAAALSPADRQDRLGSFASFLRDTTQRGRQLALQLHGEWELVSPSRLKELPDDREQRRAYLRGLTPTCPWEAVVHGWTVGRATEEKLLLESLQGAGEGFSYRCIVGAGGEGKSTLLRRIAWQTATTLDGWTVLWADPHLAQDAASLPLKWAEALVEGAKVLICVDGSRHLNGIAAGVHAHWRLRTANKRVFVLLADRGNDWLRSPTRSELLRARSRPDDQKIMLGPLQPAEQESIATLLSRNGLLCGKPLDVAVQRLRAAASRAAEDPNKPYLLPTIMQLTDPDDRGFETILESVLSDLAALPDRTAFRLILATSILHGAGIGLPRGLAERLAGSIDGLSHALAILQAELDSQRWGTQSPLPLTRAGDRFFVHHAVVAEGLIGVAYRSNEHKEGLLALCGQIPETMKADLDPKLLIPKQHFAILDRVVHYLDEESHLFEAAEHLLNSWSSLDSRLFPTIHRLAECYGRWLQQELKQEPLDRQLARQLLGNARAAYERSIQVAKGVLVGRGEPPPPLAKYTFREHEYKAYHGWAVLEGTTAAQLAEPNEARGLFLRSILLAILAFEPNERLVNAKACGTLALTLINFGEFDLAAKVTAAAIELGAARHVVNRQRRMLNAHGHRIPRGGAELLDGVFGALCTGPLLREWQAMGLFAGGYREHVDKLLEVLNRAAEWLPTTTAVDAARRHVDAARNK